MKATNDKPIECPNCRSHKVFGMTNRLANTMELTCEECEHTWDDQGKIIREGRRPSCAHTPSLERRIDVTPKPESAAPASFDFGLAIAHLKYGNRIARQGWNGKGMWLELQRPDANSKMSLPYIYMKTACLNQVPWLASQTDLLATDWVLVELEKSPVNNVIQIKRG